MSQTSILEIDGGLQLIPAFNIEVEVGEPDPDMVFTICAGSISSEPGYTLNLASSQISGKDYAILSDGVLQLNVYTNAKLSSHFNKEVQLQWQGKVILGEIENRILQGEFTGETKFGNPIANFKFNVYGDRELVELEHRFFVGEGRFVRKDQSENLRLIYKVSEDQARRNA